MCVCYSHVCPHYIMKVPPFSVPCPPTLSLSLSLHFPPVALSTSLSLSVALFPFIPPSLFSSLSVSPSLRPCVYFYLPSICWYECLSCRLLLSLLHFTGVLPILFCHSCFFRFLSLLCHTGPSSSSSRRPFV